MTRLQRIARCSLISLVCALPADAMAESAGRSAVVSGSGQSAGGVFTAGPDGADYVLPSSAHLLIAPGAMVRVFPIPQPLQLAPGPKTVTWSFSLISGRVDVQLAPKSKSAVLASIGKLSAVVTRGRAALLTSARGTIVANSDGDVRTLYDDRWETIGPAQLARLSDQHTGVAIEATIAAPTPLPGPRIWFSAGPAVPLAGVRWQAVPRANGYEVQLSHDRDGSAELVRVKGEELLTGFKPQPPGGYRLAIRAVDADGIAGPWSRVEPLRVLGVVLPPGGYIDNGRIHVGVGQDVKFSNTEGLEMTYKGAGRFVPASGSVALYRGETTIVGFRVPGSPDVATARLEPRGLFADIRLGPTSAVWPRDQVQISIEAKTKSGEPVPAWLELKPEVRLGIETLDVAFVRDKNRLVATVPPAATPGPWVLRVDVKDQFGAALGRDFLEIDAGQGPREGAPKSRSPKVNAAPGPDKVAAK